MSDASHAGGAVAGLFAEIVHIPRRVSAYVRDKSRRVRAKSDRRTLRKIAQEFDAKGRARLDSLGGAFSVGDGFVSHMREGSALFQDAMNVQKTTTTRNVEMLDMRMRRLPEIPVLNKKEIIERVQRGEVAVLDERRHDLIRERFSRVMAEAYKRLYARQHRLFREPYRPHPFAASLILFLLWAIEMGLNTQYLLVTSGGDLGQNIMLVAVTAALNIGIAYPAATVGFRNINHIERKRRVFGWVFSLLCLLACCTLHGALAHYRLAIDNAQLPAVPGKSIDYELLNERLTHAFAHLGASISAHPFAIFGDLFASMVFVSGIAFAAASAWDVYQFAGDKYPGYGERGEEYFRARDRDEGVRREYRLATLALVANERTRIEDTVQFAGSVVNAATDIVNAAIAQARHFEKQADLIDDSFWKAREDYIREFQQNAQAEAPESWEDVASPLNRDIDIDLDHYASIEEKLKEELRALTDDAVRIGEALVSTEKQLAARVEDALGEVQADAMTRAKADATLRDLSGLFDGWE